MRQVLKIIFIGTLFALSACASVKRREDALSAAQFVQRPANTPQKLAKLKALPQNKMIVRQVNQQNVYLFADAANCQCLYIGNENAYQRYRQIRVAENIADEQEAAAEMNQSAAFEYSDWGPYGGMGPGWGPY